MKTGCKIVSFLLLNMDKPATLCYDNLRDLGILAKKQKLRRVPCQF